MGRPSRIEYAGAVYHVMSRGNHRQAIFRTDQDCELFLATLGEACGRTGWRIHAYVLMGNHYHLLLETPEPNLVAGMRWLQGTYTKRFNVRHKEWGHLMQGRYKALVVDGESGGYFQSVASYIHLNPARVKNYDFGQRNLEDHPWSSYPAYLNESLRPDWLAVDRVLGSLGHGDSAEGRSALQADMTRRMIELAHSDNPGEADARWENIRRGWYLGDKDFRDALIERLDDVVAGKRRDSFNGDEIKLHDKTEAERLVLHHLQALGITDDELGPLRKSDPRKKVIAWHVRRKTAVKNEWISTRLRMGHSSNLSRYIKEVEAATDGELQELKTTK